MVFKLVRTDTEEPCKILLPSGKHLIGRGKLLECDDKRVSRKHGEIEVNDDAISIKALHQNPCFYVKKNSEETAVLKQNCVVNLANGDKFGLLPNTYWYEILHCAGLDLGDPPNIACEDESQSTDINSERSADTQVNQTIPAPNTDNVTNEMDDCDDAEFLNVELNESVLGSQMQGSQSPSLIQAGSPTLLQQMSPSLTPRETTQSVGNTSPLIPPQNDSATESYPLDAPPPEVKADPSPPKRCHSPEDSKEGVKKVKIEPVDVKQEPDAKPGPSGDQGPSCSGNADGNGDANNKNAMPPSPDKANAPAAPGPGRERCMYGANCYRKNLAHKAQFSHPCDADWGAGERGVCPWGAGCRKRDPRHWRLHDHPPAAAPPAPPLHRPGMQVVQRHGNIYYINAHSVNFYDDHFQVEDSDGDSVDFDYEF
ncbi:aprataxin and PNK-like factor isoform X2 [Pectinophora gossypiella]|uniref:aprataxin and PNK-like factor isoform X2 n=1 Tax=Pectinophora gossypiella TaxID=13191 RepID=UPI00214E9112|nr:aprataxin and PNK-like factor isoform X2 [Pectinophora gossypiella]